MFQAFQTLRFGSRGPLTAVLSGRILGRRDPRPVPRRHFRPPPIRLTPGETNIFQKRLRLCATSLTAADGVSN